MMRVNNRGDYKMRRTRRVRVQRDRRPSAIGVCGGTDTLPSSRRWILSGCSGLGIAPVGGDRAGHSSIYQPNTRRTGIVEIVNRRGTTRQTCGECTAAVNCASKVGTSQVGRRRRGNRSEVLRIANHTAFGTRFRPLSVCRGGGQKSAILQFRPRHYAEGINTKQGKSKQ